MRALLLFVFALLVLSDRCSATDGVTPYAPDIVIECRGPSGNAVRFCDFYCYNIGGSGSARVSYVFERLEFYSQPGHDSESWLVAIKGTQLDQDFVGTPSSVLFVTVSRTNLCEYLPRPKENFTSNPNPPPARGPSEVKLLKLYDRSPAP